MILGKDRPWSYADIAMLWELAKKNFPPHEIAARLSRTEESVLKKAKELDIPLNLTK